MKVYVVVFAIAYEGTILKEVFSSLSSAQKWCSEQENGWGKKVKKISEKCFSEEYGDCYLIEEKEVLE